MKDCKNRFSISFQEAKELMNIKSNKQRNRNMWICLGIGVVVLLVGLIIWLASKSSKDIEEHYEYFDDYDDLGDLEDYDDAEYDDGNLYDEDEAIEYVKIKNFMDDDEETEDADQDKKPEDETGAAEDKSDK